MGINYEIAMALYEDLAELISESENNFSVSMHFDHGLKCVSLSVIGGELDEVNGGYMVNKSIYFYESESVKSHLKNRDAMLDYTREALK